MEERARALRESLDFSKHIERGFVADKRDREEQEKLEEDSQALMKIISEETEENYAATAICGTLAGLQLEEQD